MAKKLNNKAADDAILMAIRRDIDAYFSGSVADSAASTAVIALSDIQRDGADEGDIHNIAINDVLDQTKNIPDKIRLQLSQHPDILDRLSKVVGKDKIISIVNSIDDRIGLEHLKNTIDAYLNNIQLYAEGGQMDELDNHISVKINDKEYDLVVASTEEEKELGLQNVESMEDNEGMYFDYSDDPQTELSFWMKDTIIPLDIIFVSDEDEVIDVKHGIPESEEYLTCVSEKHPITAVIEVNVNSGIKKGMDVDFEDFDESEHPELEPNKMYVIGSDGLPQAELQGEERIFSRISTRKIIKAAKKAFFSRQDKDYKKLGKIVFDELSAQNERRPEYVESRK